jgi:hypothetical protein
MMFVLLMLLVSSATLVNAETTEEDDDDEEYEPDHHRDSDGTVWIQTDIMTVRLGSDLPSFQYWYSDDNNGTLAKFAVSYLMVVEFEDQNGDGVYQPNETLSFAPLDAFEWVLQTGEVTDELGRNTEVFASYTKGGLSDEDFEDDWFEDWMPGYGEEEEEEPFVLASEEDDLNLTMYEGMTLQFYAHIYMDDYNGTVTDDEGIQAEYTIQGGVELKIDIEIGNFPFLSETSKITILNYMREDLASTEDSDHSIRLHEEDGDDDLDSEDIMDNLGEEFHDRYEEDDVQEISLIEATTNTTRGFYRWIDKAVMRLPNGTDSAVDVDASYWTDGTALLLFLAYPNFDGGSLLHDPSIGLVETADPIDDGTPLDVPVEAIAVLTIAVIAIVGIAVVGRRR